jgi:hypothetical protein
MKRAKNKKATKTKIMKDYDVLLPSFFDAE